MKVAYLGGYYPAEFSMWHSFRDHGSEIVFLYNDPTLYEDDEKLYFVPEENLKSWLSIYKPDVIVHRYYLDHPKMYPLAYRTAEKLNVPYVIYRMETWPYSPAAAVIKPVECDLFLYANPCDKRYLPSMPAPTDFWSWGVSSLERNLNNHRTIPIAGFGKERYTISQRVASLKMFIEGAWLHKKTKVWVPWDACYPTLNHLSYGLIFGGEYPLEQQTEKMNQCWCSVNFESVADIPGCYAHKMFQTLGCGTPTLTKFKPELREMFEGALIQVDGVLDISYALARILEHRSEWEKVSRKSEEVVHDKFQWFPMFDDIMRKHNLW